MSEGLPYADILILALIAGFILLRLRSVLGQKTGNENPELFMRKKEKPQENKDKVVTLHDKMPHVVPAKEEDTYLSMMENEVVAKTLEDIKAKDERFNVSNFLVGAKSAFEMVFDAFVKGDESTLKMLLADNIYKDFAAEIKRRDANDIKTETTLVSVVSRDVEDASLIGKLARVTVKFVSEQVTVERDAEGKIVGGDASKVEHVENEWVFERDTGSKNPNWKITET